MVKPLDPPSLQTTQVTWMSIMTSARNEDYIMADTLIGEFQLRYGTLIPLLIVAASLSNSILDAYAEVIEEDPEAILQSVALQMLTKGPPK